MDVVSDSQCARYFMIVSKRPNLTGQENIYGNKRQKLCYMQGAMRILHEFRYNQHAATGNGSTQQSSWA